MFTGIITHTGKFLKKSNGFKFKIPTALAKKVTRGTSIAIDGACLTVKRKAGSIILVDVMPETLEKTILGNLKYDDLVNLELPVTAESLMSGHILTGHVDGTAPLKSIIKKGNSKILKFSVPRSLSKYVTEKGSIAINGVSLTVIESGKNYFTVGIIPYTYSQTNLHALKKGDFVNLETDIFAKYLRRLVKK